VHIRPQGATVEATFVAAAALATGNQNWREAKTWLRLDVFSAAPGVIAEARHPRRGSMDSKTRARLFAGGLISLASLTATTCAPAAVSAAYQIKNVDVSRSAKFSNDSECAPAAVKVRLRRGAYAVKVEDGPSEGEALYDSRDTSKEVGVVTGVRVRPEGRSEVLWGAKPLPGGCRGHYGDPVDYNEFGDPVYGPPEYFFWDTERYDFEVSYRVRHRVQLTRHSAAGLASEALSRRFDGAYNYGEGYPHCRRPQHNRASCSITFFAGDTYWVGRVNVRVGTTRNHRKLRWSYRMNVLQVDDYCLSVNHGTRAQCTRRIRRSRKHIPVPGGSL
jgi:hypothetical protein